MWSWWDNFNQTMEGKWVSNRFSINGNNITIFLNIVRLETGVTISFGYNDSTCPSKMLYVEYSNDSLFFFHNDFSHRAKFILTVESIDLLKCQYSIKNCYSLKGKLEQDIEFTRYELLPKEEIKKYEPSIQIKKKDQARIDILKEYAVYGNIKFDFNYLYKFDERENLLDIINEYNLDQLVLGKSDVEIAITLMNWVCQHYKHGNPINGLPKERTPQALMNSAKSFENRTNCRGLSLILVQLIRAYNLPAFHVTCMPYEQPFNDCHVVVNVYCDSLKKYIMLDPTSNLYLRNKSGDIIDIEEFRAILIADEEITFNDDYFSNLWSIEGYRNYMAKNLIRIERYLDNRYGNDWVGGNVILVSEKYYHNEVKLLKESTQDKYITDKDYFWKLS